MNREIKFRAWDKEDSKMYKVVSISESIWGHEEDKHLLICDFDKNPMNQKTDVRISVNYELMEFTGLHDENGVEIYEGDLIKDGSKIFKIIFKHGCFGIYKKEKLSFDSKEIYEKFIPIYNYFGTDIDCVVIGNIYENENLLKQKDV